MEAQNPVVTCWNAQILHTCVKYPWFPKRYYSAYSDPEQLPPSYLSPVRTDVDDWQHKGISVLFSSVLGLFLVIL